MKYPYVVERILDHFPYLDPESVVWRVRHSTFVSLDKRYMYFEVPKAACTQMKDLIRTTEGAPPIKLFANGTPETRRQMFIHGRSNVPVPSLVDLDDTSQREVLESPDFLRMTIVRNPYTRLISAWRNRVLLCEPGEREVYLQVKGGLPGLRNKSFVSFEDFIGFIRSSCDLRTCNCHWRRQVDHIFFPVLNFSLIAKLEQLGDGLRRFGQHLGFPEPLVADGRNLSMGIGSAAYTKDLADRVYSLYRKDFEGLGYDRESWRAYSEHTSKKSGGVPEEKFCDEIIERNIVILRLYEERADLQVQLDRVSRLHLLPIVNGLARVRKAVRRISRELTRWVRCLSRSAEQGQQSGVTSA